MILNLIEGFEMASRTLTEVYLESRSFGKTQLEILRAKKNCFLINIDNVTICNSNVIRSNAS